MRCHGGGPAHHITRIKVDPESTREKPWKFQCLGDAIDFARITMRKVWVTVGPDVDLFEVWPGGRINDWSKAIEHLNARDKERGRPA